MRSFKYFLLDIEGTIVLDKLYAPVPGAVKWYNSLIHKGISAHLVTNNTTESPDDLYSILRKKGFVFAKNDFFTCLTEAVVRMKKQNVKSCLTLAKPAVGKYLLSEGIKPKKSFDVDSVLVGYDPTLTYQKLNLAVKAIIDNGAILYTLHRNRRFMNEKREIAMSSGPIAAALENACMVKAVVCGKPDRHFFLDSVKSWNVSPNKILMVSDDPFADLIGAKKIGMKTCWVLTGSQKDSLAVKKIKKEYRPDYIFESVVDIPI